MKNGKNYRKDRLQHNSWANKGSYRKAFDLLGHEGERVRIHIGEDGKLTTEISAKQKELVCELDVPEKRWEHIVTGETDDFGNPIIESKLKELDITKVALKKYIKQVEEI